MSLRSTLLQGGALALLVCGTYANSLGNRFNIDDPSVLLDVHEVHGLSTANLKAIFTSVPGSVEYLPVRDLTYCIDYELWGLSPTGYHLSNLIYYLGACLALFFLLRELLRRIGQEGDHRISAIAAALFAVHPVHVESVAGIAQRKDLLSGLFFFLSLLAFVRSLDSRRRRLLYLASITAFGLAMLSKASAVVLPVLLVPLLLFYLPVSRRRLWLLAPFVGLAAALTALDLFIAVDAGIVMGNGPPLFRRLAIALSAPLYYLRFLAVPYPLTIWHEPSIPWAKAIPLTLGAAMLVWAGLRWRHSQRVLSAGILWYLIGLAPVSGLLPTASVLAERYLFLPSAGFALVTAWGIDRGLSGQRKWLVAIAAAVLLAVFAGLSVRRNRDWRNTETLLLAGLRHSPSSVKLTQSLGRYYFLNRRLDEAFQYFTRAKELDGRDLNLEFHLALLALQSRDHVRALALLNAGALRTSDAIDVHYLRGQIYERLGLHAEARASYARGLKAHQTAGMFFKRNITAAVRALDRQRVP